MIVIYDLDRTLLYSPIAMFLDLFRPKNKVLLKLYYKLYPLAYILDTCFKTLKVNVAMAKRIAYYSKLPNVYQVVLSARDNNLGTHIQLATVPNSQHLLATFLIAQARTNIMKYQEVETWALNDAEEIIIFDDNIKELKAFKENIDNATCIRVDFDGKEEKFIEYVN